MKLVLGTFVYAIGSALIPVLNLEAYLAVIAAASSTAGLVALAIASGAGQTIGKVAWYFAGRQAMSIPSIRRKMETEKWQRNYLRWQSRVTGRPVFAGVLCFVSALSGFPPLAVIAVLAGSLRLSFTMFVLTCLIGRVLRFWLILVGSDLLIGWVDVLIH